MKATGIVRRVDDLGRIVIPKEQSPTSTYGAEIEVYADKIRSATLKVREGDPSLTTLIPFDKFCWATHSVVNRYKTKAR